MTSEQIAELRKLDTLIDPPLMLMDANCVDSVDLRPGAINCLGPPPPELPLTRWQRFRNAVAARIEAIADRVRWSDW